MGDYVIAVDAGLAVVCHERVVPALKHDLNPCSTVYTFIVASRGAVVITRLLGRSRDHTVDDACPSCLANYLAVRDAGPLNDTRMFQSPSQQFKGSLDEQMDSCH